MNTTESIKAFDSFIFRAPILPYSQLNYLLSKIDDLSILEDKLVKEAIFLASPDFFSEIERLQSKKGDATKARMTLLKYLLRMSTRCTPFGLFSGTGVGFLGEENEIIIQPADKHKIFTRFDNNYLCSLIKDIGAIPAVQDQLRYRVNTSLYPAGNHYRYIEYLVVNGGRVHILSSVERNEYLDTVLAQAVAWVTIEELCESLIKEDITKQEAKEYIQDLIKNQIIVSELEPSVTGEDQLNKLCKQVSRLQLVDPTIATKLRKTKALLVTLDKEGPGRKITSYLTIKEVISGIRRPERLKYLFQSNLLLAHQKACVSREKIETLIEGIRVANKLTPYLEHPFLTKFKEEFVKRFDSEERPLMESLDPEIGIGFGEMGNLSGDINTLLGGITFNASGSEVTKRTHAPVEDYLQFKYEEYLLDSSVSCIELKEHELSRFKENWDTVPDTFSALVKFTDGDTIMLNTAGGSSASSIISRFGNASSQINDLILEIIKAENDKAGDKILAEIVHLPESRSGNVLNRTRIRNYEIPILANPCVGDEYVIPINDIMVSVRSGKIFLRSKKHNKEIRPMLTTALQFTGRALPAYQFLCFIQLQNMRGMLGLKWGETLERKTFLPRVKYKNIILAPAMWNIQPSQVSLILKSKGETFIDECRKFKAKYKIPDKVLLEDGDNKLLIDFNHEPSITLLFSIVKKEPFRLLEFIEDQSTHFITREEDVFTNELIFFFQKKNIL